MTFSRSELQIVARSDCAREVALAIDLIEQQLFGVERDLAEDGVDPLVLLEVMRLNKVAAFIPPALFSRQLKAAPSAIATLDMIRLRSMALNTVGMKDAAAVSKVLHAANLDHLHFKGPLQQLALYGNAFLKPSGDIDILIEMSDKEQAIGALSKAGYETFDAHLATWWWRFLGELHLKNPKSGIVVDLHHDVQQAGLPRPLRGGGLLERRTRIRHGSDSFLIPVAADVCVIASITIAKAMRSHEPCLSAVVDLRVAFNRLGDEERADLVEIARRSGMTETLLLGLQAVAAVFPGAEPSDLLSGSPARVFEDVDDHQLRQMIVTPWVEGLKWPRNRRFIAELSGQRVSRRIIETLRLIMSEGMRKLLEKRRKKDASAP